jgi:hypothetical protein
MLNAHPNYSWRIKTKLECRFSLLGRLETLLCLGSIEMYCKSAIPICPKGFSVHWSKYLRYNLWSKATPMNQLRAGTALIYRKHQKTGKLLFFAFNPFIQRRKNTTTLTQTWVPCLFWLSIVFIFSFQNFLIVKMLSMCKALGI